MATVLSPTRREGQVLETAFFDDLSSDPGAGIDVTFQVDMALLIEDECIRA